jgi:chemotaxis signal transduction protein
MSELVTFTLDGQNYATRVDDVREVVRLPELAVLPGIKAPVVGILDLRGLSVPVVDIRRSPGPTGGDVLIVGDAEAGGFGFACERGTDVAAESSFTTEKLSGDSALNALPAYVESVLRGDAGPIYLVDVRRMAQEYADGLASDVALENRALGKPGQALADALGTGLPDSVDRL